MCSLFDPERSFAFGLPPLTTQLGRFLSLLPCSRPLFATLFKVEGRSPLHMHCRSTWVHSRCTRRYFFIYLEESFCPLLQGQSSAQNTCLRVTPLPRPTIHSQVSPQSGVGLSTTLCVRVVPLRRESLFMPGASRGAITAPSIPY